MTIDPDERAGESVPGRGASAGHRRASDEYSATPWAVIGPYRLGEVLGEGGMGTVYRAFQTEPVQREVALKIIKLGMDTEEVVARFRSEREALALMDHTGIARVLDAGATEDGRPFFVMELVRGVPLDEYCDTQKLSTTDRLDLFARVCDAVHHAHQKGVIHRDLKPSNVLVTVEDDRPIPKVIDFGIAKAVTQSAQSGLVTTMGQMLGTPTYMSPEQAEKSGLDVDTRTDVYSLGVILYEILSGHLPFDRETLAKPDFVLQFLLREKDVPRPSVRFGSLADTQRTVARNRRTDIRTLRRQLRGDLDWIVMRAIEKDRTRRYGAASELAADVRRFMAGEPVLARPPSLAYRTGKFARRHRAVLAVAAALVISLIWGATAAGLGFLRAEHAAEAARQESARAEAVTEFLTGMLRAADPVSGSGAETTVREVLDEASADVTEGALGDQPLVEITVRRAIAGTYMQLGLLDEAARHFEVALALVNVTPGVSDSDRVRVLDEIGQVRRRQGDLEAAEVRYRHALSLADSAGLVVEGGKEEDLINRVRNDLGLLLRDAGRLDEAAELLEALAASERNMPDVSSMALATTLNNLALVRRGMNDIDGAIALFGETLELLREEVGDEHVYVAAVLESIGSLHGRAGRYETADSLMVAALAMRQRVLPERHPDIQNSLNGLGLLHTEMQDYEVAERYLSESLEMSLDLFGETHNRTGQVLNNLGLLYLRRGEFTTAAETFRRSARIRQDALGDRHPNTLNARGNLASALVEAGDPEAAERIAAEVVAAQREVGVTDVAMLGSAARTWGSALRDLGRFDAAESHLIEAFEMQDAEWGETHAQTQSTIRALVDLYEKWGRDGEADSWRGRLAG